MSSSASSSFAKPFRAEIGSSPIRRGIIIPVLNERASLPALLAALLPQLRNGDEVVFIDAGSSDETLGFLREAAVQEARLRVIEAPGSWCGQGRNQGIAETEAGIIVHLDGGNIPAPGWLDRLCAPLEEGADFVTGNVKPQPVLVRVPFLSEPFDLGNVYAAALFPRSEIRRFSADATPFAGCSVAYRRDLWQQAGGLPDWLPRGEDTLFVQRLEALSCRFAQAEDAVVFWQLGPGPGAIARRYWQRQLKAFRSSADWRAGRKNVWLHAVAGLMAGVGMGATLVFPMGGLVGSLPLLLLWACQARAGLQAAATWRQGKKQPDRLLYALSLLGLAGLAVGVRILASLRGLLCRPYPQREWEQRAMTYLNAPPVTTAIAKAPQGT